MNTFTEGPKSENDPASGEVVDADGVAFAAPAVADGLRMWEIARDTGVLDLNSTYAYTLWAKEFARTSVVARVEGRVVGFVTGFHRPSESDSLFIWQVGVDADQRGKRLAARMLHAILDRLEREGDGSSVRLRTTISPDNEASQKLFASVARDRGKELTREDYLSVADLGEGHQPEDLYTIA